MGAPGTLDQGVPMNGEMYEWMNGGVGRKECWLSELLASDISSVSFCFLFVIASTSISYGFLKPQVYSVMANRFWDVLFMELSFRTWRM